MKITALNVDRLKPEAQKSMLINILDSLARYIEDDHLDEDSIQRLLESVLNELDDNYQDDEFGTEGWRHSVLGEDD